MQKNLQKPNQKVFFLHIVIANILIEKEVVYNRRERACPSGKSKTAPAWYTRDNRGIAKRKKMKKNQKIGAKESKRKKKKKKGISASDIVLMLIFIVALAVAAFAGYRLYSIMMEYKAGVDEYSQIADTVVKERDADKEKIKKLKDAETGEEVKHWESPLDIDFKELKSINPDVAGWIYMEALPDISYPIVQGDDNEFYLHHTYKKESIFAGSIFVDCKNSKDFSDQNTIVYGHNMKNGSMFGTLKNYKLQETVDKSPYFWIITKKDAYKYKIFSIYTANVDGDTYTLIKGPGKETVEYANNMKAKSNIDMGEFDFKETDKIVTLSTCTGDTATRFVVQGVRVEPE